MTRVFKKYILVIIIVLVAVIIISLITFYQNRPSELDDFTRCLKDDGAKFYGAFWCPHCQNQKKLFGRSQQFLPYIECSMPDGRSQTITCKNDNITQYPTWVFPDQSQLVGEISLAELAAKTNCQLP